jgi:hypothetical protein
MKPPLKFVTGMEHRSESKHPCGYEFSTPENTSRNAMKIEHIPALICAVSAVAVAAAQSQLLEGLEDLARILSCRSGLSLLELQTDTGVIQVLVTYSSRAFLQGVEPQIVWVPTRSLPPTRRARSQVESSRRH